MIGEILAALIRPLFWIINFPFALMTGDGVSDAQREHQSDLDAFQERENAAKFKCLHGVGEDNELLG